MPVLYMRIVLDSLYLLTFYSEKLSTWIWCLPFGANKNLNLLIEDSLSLPGTAVQSIILWLLKFASSLLSGQNLLF